MPSEPILTTWPESLLSLFYPRLCLACGQNLPSKASSICLSCNHQLPKTDFHLQADNPFTERFWGRIPLHAGAACYHFSKSGRTQQLLHHLKYGGKREVGVEIGKIYGADLLQSPLFRTVAHIVPVPLHPRRKRQRGYNQAAAFAQGLSQAMKLPWSEALIRTQHTSSQTSKTRMERFANVSQVFALRDESAVQGKLVLLVDDVMTTGATLEACAHCLLQAEGTSVAMCTIAIAN